MGKFNDRNPGQARPAPNWVSFTCRVEDATGMISVDAGWMGHQGFAGAQRLLILEIPFNAPPGPRVVDPAELPQLQDLGDRVAEALAGETAFLLGMVYASGMMEIYAFTLDEGADAARALAAARSSGLHSVSHKVIDDPEWKWFTEFLYPDPLSWQNIGNARVRNNLAKNGDPGTLARMIDHAAFFPDRRSAESYATAITRLGHEVTKLSESDEQAANGEPFIVEFSREDIPAGLDPVTTELFLTARDHGGRYDGWGCLVLKPQA